MWLSLFLLAFLIAATYFQAIQGLTSAAITCVLAVISLALAFGTHEYIAESLLMGLLPEYAYAFALFGMFIIPFGILRVLMDMWIPRSNLLPLLVDRIAGAAVGLGAAFLATGVLAITIQMIPWGGSFLGFSRVDLAEPDKQNDLWLKPDRVAAAFGAALSDGVFSGERSFREAHPDWVSELGWTQSVPLGVRRVAERDSVSVVSAGRVDFIYDVVFEESKLGAIQEIAPVDPQGGHIFAQVTLKISGESKDNDDKSRFMPLSIRLVGDKDGDPDTPDSIAYTAAAVRDPDDPNRYVRKWKFGPRGEQKTTATSLFLVPENNQVDVVFEVPERFTPRFVAYKYGGQAAISKNDISGHTPTARVSGTSTAGATPSPAPSPSAQASGSSGGGRVSGVKFRSSHFGDDMFVTMTAYQSYETEVRSGVLEQGHIQGPLEEQGSVQRGGPVSKFKVPEGKALLQLNVESLRAGSTLGKALNFSVQTVENYSLEDDQGKRYTPVGKCAVANVGGQDYVEIQYFPAYAEGGGRVPPMSKIKNPHLKGDYQLVYLFLLDHGRRAVRFSTGRSPVDLSGLNLVAQ